MRDYASPEAIEAEAHELIARGHTMLAEAARLRATQAKATSPAPAPTPGTAPLVDKRGCAYALGVSPATIDRLVRDGRIPYRIVGDSRRFDLAAVIAALEEHKVATKTNTVATPPWPPDEPIPGVRLLSRRKPTPGRKG
jgi:excisionase family DNA binding protein